MILILGILGWSLASASLQTNEVQVPLSGRTNEDSNACSALRTHKPNQALLPDRPEYDNGQTAYWSLQQTGLHPDCHFLPQTAFDVRDALHMAKTFNASIAVVSGGHSSNQGASNIDSGITIDLGLVSGVEILEDSESVWIGPGSQWSEVYAALEPHGVTVAGGRVGHVGVGGYVLGGGYSWHANLEGWSCDSVLEFEVVAPDLEILHASASSHADLFWALKGSLGAFGIVTGIKMKTMRDAGFYGGAIDYDEDALLAVFAGLKEMSNNAETEPNTSGYLSFAYIAKTAEWVYNTYLINTANTSSSRAIGNFLMIPNEGHTLKHMTPKESADEIAASNPLGFRRSKFTLTILPTMEALRIVHGFAKESASDMQLSDDELLGVTYQPLTVPHLRKQNNIFSNYLTANNGPLMLVSIELRWKDASKDALLRERNARAVRGWSGLWVGVDDGAACLGVSELCGELAGSVASRTAGRGELGEVAGREGEV